jgi:DNA-binding response OmpR family regulator
MMSTSTPAILLIEKDEVTLELYQRELCNSFTVFAFTELNDVLGILAQRDIKAIVIEPEIHGGKGWELIDTIREIFPYRTVPIIVCSTRDATRDHKQRNITLYLTKPVLPKTLREKALEVISSK